VTRGSAGGHVPVVADGSPRLSTTPGVLALEPLTIEATVKRLPAMGESARTARADVPGYALREQREGVAAEDGK